MEIIKTPIPDLIIFKPAVFKDDRGYFFEAYNDKRYKESGIQFDFVQDNISFSSRNTIRGLHYQVGDYAQSKLVQVVQGKVIDVAVDLRKSSPTYGKHFAIELSAENNLQFYIPRGFAHGFSVLSETALFHYKCDNFYNKESERGIIYNDKSIGIDWQIDLNKAIVSEKDIILPNFEEATKFD